MVLPIDEIIVSINISADEYLKFYQGVGKVVATRDISGRTVRFPARILQPFVTRQGISGVFKIAFNRDGKFEKIERLKG